MREGLTSCSSRAKHILVVEDEKDEKVGEVLDGKRSGVGVKGEEKIDDGLMREEKCGEVEEVSKRARRVGESRSGVGGVEEEEKTRKEGRGFGVMVPIRVLRSRVVMGRGVKKTVGEEERVGSVDVKFRGNDVSGESKRGETDQNQKVEELSDETEKPIPVNVLKRKRGRPGKSSTCSKVGSADPLVGESSGILVEDNLEKGEIESVQVEKSSQKENLRKGEFKPSEVEDGVEGMNLKRKRGRPRKSSICSGVVVTGKDGGSADALVGESSRNLMEENLKNGETESVQVEKHSEGANSEKRRGRPPKMQTSNDDTLVGGGFRDADEENLGKGEIKPVEVEGDAGEMNLKRKRGRPRKSSICSGVVVTGEDGGSANTLVGESSRNLVEENLEKGETKSVQVEKSSQGENLEKSCGRLPKMQSGSDDTLFGGGWGNEDEENLRNGEFKPAEGEDCTEGMNLKRKRGRPRKSSICSGVIVTGEGGGSVDALVGEGSRNLVEENLEKGKTESMQFEKTNKGANSKKRRGRPPKMQSGNEDTLVGAGLGDADVENLRKGKIKPLEVEDGAAAINLKRKRGRPPKMKISDAVIKKTDNKTWFGEGGSDVAGEMSRNGKLESADVEKDHKGVNLKRKHGRPPKLQIGDDVMKKCDEGILVSEAMKDVAEKNLSKMGAQQTELQRSTRRMNGSEKETLAKGLDKSDEPATQLESGVGRPTTLQDSNGGLEENPIQEEETFGSGKHQQGSKLRQSANEDKASDLSSKDARGFKTSVGKSTEGDGTVPRNEAKQKVRDKIVDMLMKAGWSIEYRPRNNREYNDAVYVNPDGRTHWSVTLAYKVLKQEYEDSNGHLKAAEKDFVFTPLPEEELGILARVIVKQREDKGKAKKKDSVGKSKQDDVPKKKKQKDKSSRKQNAAARRKRYSLLVRRSNKEVKPENVGYMPYRRKKTLLAWLIDSGTVPENSRVRYMKQKGQTATHEGTITRDGVKCDCCDKFCMLSEFEKHAGSQLCQPYQNIFLESGASLLECQLDSWRKEEELSESEWFHLVDVDCEDPNDDSCNLCGEGGDLICCDSCPSTFHQSCLALQNFPSGDWQCFRCTCKFCVAFGGKEHQQNNEDNVAATALDTCRLCEEKYHRECIEERSAVKDDTTLSTFCGKTCQEIFMRLQPLLGVKQQLEEGFSWRLIQRTDVDSDISLHETQKNLEGNLNIAIALSVMNECFLPIVDHKSGVNLMRNIVYSCGSNFTRLNYTGFYTAILERDDEIIAAACIRIHGCHLAEMPFIGVREFYRRQGMCRRLLGAIESGLGSLHVEKLVIPAVTELKDTWMSIFGFKQLECSNKLHMRNMNILVFPGTNMLQKPLLDKQPAERSLIPAEGLASTELVHQNAHGMSKSSDMGWWNGSGHKMCHAAHYELTAVGSNLQLLNDSSHQSFGARENFDLQEFQPTVISSFE